MDDFEWRRSFTTSSYGTVTDAPASEPKEPRANASATSRGSFASFVCHVINLERKLRSFSPLVLNNSSYVKPTGKILGQGKTFMVRHAQWVRNPQEPPLDVALKEIILDAQASDSNSSSNRGHRPQSDWKDILFELRALLHEPIRYHPNIVQLLGIQWGLSPISESTYPVLIMEYASLGTFDTLQASSEPLSFAVKQKLCYDVGRGLSALHACGIVHGDIKHENVLIFPSKKPIGGIQYTAKLADFGGAVMDITSDEFREMETWTWPFQAPEISSRKPLTRNGMMLTDIYSFGLLVWRAFMDGEGFVSLDGAAQTASDEDKQSLSARKASEDFTSTAIADIYTYARGRGFSESCINVIVYTIYHTVRFKPEDRDLVKAQATLRGIKPGHVLSYLGFVQGKNEELDAAEAQRAPGSHGITRDSLQFMLGRYGNDADLQDNIPGFRPRLSKPNPEEFSFEPETLKTILTWEQQQQMLDEMKEVAEGINQFSSGLLEMKKSVAAFYVFQCYLQEFGTTFNPEEGVRWLQKASSDDNSHEDADYFSQAWLWRISRALDVESNLTNERLDALLSLSIMRGHQTSLQDMQQLIAGSEGSMKQHWLDKFQLMRNILFSQMGAVGMGHFFPKYLTRPWNMISLENIAELDGGIRTVLGSTYDSCLKSVISSDSSSTTQTGRDKERTAFDRIYVNGRGHGLLHYAAATGAFNALRHMVTKYECDINIPNQHVEETPLVCACEGGKLECALLLINNTADPNGWRFGQEGPLHWLCSFSPTEMETIASRLVVAGADLELRGGGMRQEVRGIRADWEAIFEISTTPLGRAVLMNNLAAVKVLLKLGANPLTKSANKHRGQWEGLEDMSKLIDVSSPFELAAVLTLPEILAEFIKHIDGPSGTPRLKLLDEASMLDIAHDKKVTKFDPLSLQSRLVRCGANWKRNLRATLSLLYARAQPFYGIPSDELQKERSRVLCKEVTLGNVDIVESLLGLGYSANGTDDYRPLEKAIEMNHEEVFNLLMRHKADATVTLLTPVGRISMLQVAASRPRQSRPGRGISDGLIAAGIPIESADPRTRPPLATAILNQNFDVAQALIENGANVNAFYPLQLGGPNGPETKTVNILVEVLSEHTMRTIESLKFLFGKRTDGPEQPPAFYVDPSNKVSILHFLAWSPQFTQIAQITPKILNLCLENYAEHSLINYKHPLFGTTLYHAAANGHKPMVERLLEHGADATYNAGPDVDGSVQILLRPRESWTPLWAAILRFDEELKKCTLFPPEGPLGAWLISNSIHNVEKIIDLLSKSNDDALAKRAIEQIQQRKASLETEFYKLKIEKRNKRRDLKAREDEAPVDLGILSTEGGQRDEKKIREICEGPEQEWRNGAIDELLKSLKL